MGRILKNLQRKKDMRFNYKTQARDIKLQKKAAGEGFFDKLGDGLKGGIFSKMTGGMYGGESQDTTGGSYVPGNSETGTGGSGTGFKIGSIPFIPIALILGLVFIAKKVFFNGSKGQVKSMGYA